MNVAYEKSGKSTLAGVDLTKDLLKEIEAIGDDDPDEPDDDEEDAYCDPPEGCVRLRPSIAGPFLSPTIYFEYPPELKLKRRDSSLIEPIGSRKIGYKSHWERICIRNAFIRAGFKKSSKYWTAMWSKHQNSVQIAGMNCLQKVNHFPDSWCIGRKDRLSRTLNTMKRIHGSEYDFHPDTYIMPNDHDHLLRALKTDKNPSSSLWIMKPVASSCGRGISVINSTQATAIAEKKQRTLHKATQLGRTLKADILIQRYLKDPLLIGDKKFDLRIYVLITGVDPLRVYIHHEGLTRISTSSYSERNINNRFAHLTNYSVNKNAANFVAAAAYASNTTSDANTECLSNSSQNSNSVRNNVGDGCNELNIDLNTQNISRKTATSEDSNNPSSVDPEQEGFKWSLGAFKRWLADRVGSARMTAAFQEIDALCVKVALALEGSVCPLPSTCRSSSCFELFGLDVLLDRKLRPHLLEVNVSPSLVGSSPLDRKIKGMLIADCLHTVGMYPHDQQMLRKYDMDSSGANAVELEEGEVNPFVFAPLGRRLNGQELFRRDPKPENIDLVALANSAFEQPDIGWWVPLLQFEDEMARAMTGGLRLLHPCPGLPSRYASLYKAPRFADYCLMKWLSTGGVASLANQNLLPINVRDAVRGSLKTMPVPEHYATWLTTANMKAGNGSSSTSSSSGKYLASASGAMRPKSAAVMSMMRLGSAVPSSRRATAAADNPPPPLPRTPNSSSSSARARPASATATRRISSSPAVLAQQALVLPPMLPQQQRSPLNQSSAIKHKQLMLQEQQEIALLMSTAAVAEQRRLHAAMDTRTLAYLDVMHPPTLMTPTKPVHMQSGGNGNSNGTTSPLVRKLTMSGREMKTTGGYLDF